MALFKIRYYLLAILIVIVLLKFRYYLLATLFVMALLKVRYNLLAQILPLIKVLLLILTTVPHYHHSQLQIMNLNQIIQKIQQKQKLLFRKLQLQWLVVFQWHFQVSWHLCFLFHSHFGMVLGPLQQNCHQIPMFLSQGLRFQKLL